jgi:cytochrome d ubiquinol oxidase subunit II
METFWFIALAFMIAMYVVLDGFDLGAGTIHLLSAKNDNERRTILNAIGPVWDGNEVWLLAAGGILFFAFPKLYASSFSGFYLPLMIVLWLLIGRAIGIELRKHVDNTLWKSFWDVVFSISSLLLAIFFGAALGNVIRGVPLQADGYFFEPLWTTFTVVPDTGILDWFTVLMGLVSLFVLTSHGANYVSMKTHDELQMRARKISSLTNWGVLVTSVLALISVKEKKKKKN